VSGKDSIELDLELVVERPPSSSASASASSTVAPGLGTRLPGEESPMAAFPRRHNFAVLGLLAAAALSMPPLSRGPARADKGVTDGVYKDNAGGQHPWSIERSHALIWDEKPYTPGGVMFRSHFLPAPSEATFKEDVDLLDTLKAAGVHDLLLDPGKG